MKNDKNNKQDVAIKGLQTDMKWIKREITDIKQNHLTSIYKAIGGLKNAIGSRPTWFVTLVITSLLSILTGLSVYLLTH